MKIKYPEQPTPSPVPWAETIPGQAYRTSTDSRNLYLCGVRDHEKMFINIASGQIFNLEKYTFYPVECEVVVL